MQKQPNISVPDRYIRFVVGMLSVGCATSRRRHSTFTRALLYSFGAMKMAEGVTGWCPLQAVTTKFGSIQLKGQASSSQNAKTTPETPDTNGDYPPSYAQYQNDQDG